MRNVRVDSGIAELGEMKSLEWLDLRGAYVSDLTLTRLEGFKKLNRLV